MSNDLRLHLDKIADNPNNTVRIHLGGASFVTGINSQIKGYLNSSVRLGGSNNYNAPFENDLDYANQLATKAQQVSKNLIGQKANVPDFIIKSAQQTVLSWVGSDRFSFSISLLFISYKRNDNNVLTPLRALLSAVNPFSTGSASLSNLTNLNITTIAPRRYTSFTVKGEPVGIGTSSVNIGKWFKANKLIVKSMDFDVSKETLDDGNPLYGTATVNFESFKMLSELEVLSFIVDPTQKIEDL